MKAIPVEQSVGTVLCHDITRIVVGESKGPAFRRGHVVTDGDIQTLLDIGKANIYVFDPKDGYVHEDDAAFRLAGAAAGKNITFTGPSEGKVTLEASIDGLLSINTDALTDMNCIKDVTFATIHNLQFVKKGRALAGTRVIPLAVPEEILFEVESLCEKSGPVIEVKPLKAARVGVVTTGSEVYTGRIKDGFGPVLKRKFAELGSTVANQVFVSDEIDMTVSAIHSFVEQGVDLIAVTGGMSVDPDDQTPSAIRATSAEVISYGAPTYPGAMFMLAYLAGIPVVGLPGCVMYHKASIFDLVVPRILAGEKLSRRDIVAFGHGGFCEGCETCRYPVCGFGKI
ncbi:molybdopterin-binding protein [Desulforhopalus sp. IMCC35007]|uniref:molybdopterin-binding protein n=1 Tax=Desulforhopalus sp. IMCC35007 TaxID=2569543 RepID=UPI0010AE0CEF|nr:molybdopterin-binding protein [Desulforhopalus sp. IMCC35007]TKB12350.1 molybdopterin-binding protein [Desulforhopalus sp. IMCC35007]